MFTKKTLEETPDGKSCSSTAAAVNLWESVDASFKEQLEHESLSRPEQDSSDLTRTREPEEHRNLHTTRGDQFITGASFLRFADASLRHLRVFCLHSLNHRKKDCVLKPHPVLLQFSKHHLLRAEQQ
ncbi:unnamed protein product [Pleuronectes platessa]|uniref:Uncharacterized protein n=1 Tax=Pleuronectes platessa TaxID=8262 RepID=A0A9N7VRV3_PLEPL|nr:unnamed protein product [Pleuronectes platessa]